VKGQRSRLLLTFECGYIELPDMFSTAADEWRGVAAADAISCCCSVNAVRLATTEQLKMLQITAEVYIDAAVKVFK